jgi:coenzyme F420-reducing hydrogenase delta subunit/ferredoxin
VLQRIESWFDAAFGSDNPLRHLGALSFFFFWIVAASGLYVYAVFDTSVDGAYDSVERLSNQWYLGGVMRSLHRYASDAFAVTVILHLGKEFIQGHFRGFRWFSWITGVPLLWLMYASGIGGYWLVWDELAQFSLTATMEWLDWLPLFAQPLVRNFLSAQQLNDRFFSLLIFLHIGIPLVLLLGMWLHIQRLSYAGTVAPKRLAIGTLAALLLLALIKPALSHAPADMANVPARIELDWFYLFVHPLTYESSESIVWMLATGLTILLMLLPVFVPGRRQTVAQVDLNNCNGCGRCANDCPYAAVIMQPRTDHRRHPRQAVVLADLCASCGICAGACPSSTPFRSIATLTSGIDMPQQPIDALRADMREQVRRLSGAGKIVVFGCACASDVEQLRDARTAVLSLLCIGMLPPSFIEYAIRYGADGVFITGCREGACTYRLGNRWTVERIRGEREPHLRQTVPGERLRVKWAGAGDFAQLLRELAEFRQSLLRASTPPLHKELA